METTTMETTTPGELDGSWKLPILPPNKTETVSTENSSSKIKVPQFL